MSDGFVGIDPVAARELAAVMRTAVGAWRRERDELSALATTADLMATAQVGVAALDDVAGTCELAATDLDRRAEWIDAVDQGDGALAGALSSLVAGTITAWEAAVSGGVDDAPVVVTGTTGDDLLSRFVGAAPSVDGPGVACFGDDYWTRGHLVGLDGRTYALSTPRVGETIDDVRVNANADWGPAPDGLDVWTLDGADPGWVTIGREQGVGRVEPDIGGVDLFIAGDPGQSIATSSGYSPASMAEHAALTFDEYGVPVGVVVAGRGTIHLSESVPEIEGQTPVMTVGPGGHVRYEMTTPRGQGAALGAAELVGMAAVAGQVASTVREQGNYAYAVEYQEHPDGRRRAVPIVYHLAADANGDPVVFMGYLGPGPDGELTAMPVTPRVHGDYRPAVPVNPET